MKAHDAIIVGGGPAGSSAAITLAARGLRVLLLEEKRMPRAKLCGEFITPESFPTLERLGVLPTMMAAGVLGVALSGACLADTVFLDVPGRTAKRLLELSGRDDEFRLRMTQEDLAGLVGASRERVNKALSMFTRLGWLAVEGRNRYRILDRAALEERAEV